MQSDPLTVSGLNSQGQNTYSFGQGSSSLNPLVLQRCQKVTEETKEMLTKRLLKHCMPESRCQKPNAKYRMPKIKY